MDFNLQSILENDLVTLRPIVQKDFEPLFKVAADPLVWEQHQNKDRYTQEAFNQFFNEALASKGALVIVDNQTAHIIGSSRFRIIDEIESVIEIGWSFLGRDYWGGKYNRKCKKLMIDHALQSFERVVFYVNPKNFRSQRALEKLGAKRMDDFGKSWVLPKDKGVTFMIDAPLS